MKRYLHNLFSVTIALLLLYGCSKLKPGYWMNDQIPSSVRSDMHDRNKNLLEYLKNNDDKRMGWVVSREMMDKNSLIKMMQPISHAVNTNEYAIYKEYYIVNKWRSNDTIPKQKDGDDEFTLTYEGTAKEMYMAFLLPKTGDNKKMITLVYSKLDYGWRLTDMEIGDLIINGMTAPQALRLAMEKVRKGYISDAVTTAEIAFRSRQPNTLWQYRCNDSIRMFYGVAISKANELFKSGVITMTDVPTHPQIYRVSNKQTLDGSYYPVVYYLTTVDLKNFDALRRENLQIQKAIGKVIPGIDKDKKLMYYSAFNERTKQDIAVRQVDFTEKLQ